MKTTTLTKLFLLAVATVTLASCTGWDDYTHGTLSLNEHITVRDTDGRSHSLVNGPAQFQFKHGIFGVTNPKVQITQSDASSFEVAIPRARFQNDQITVSSAELRQEVGLSVVKEREVLQTWESSGTESCTYYGYCFQFLPSGKYEFQFGPGCNGTASVTRRYHRIQERLAIYFNRRGVGDAGRFISDTATVYVNGAEVLERSSCL